MRDCEKVHQQLAQALANELAQRVVLVAESPNGASSSKKERVANKEGTSALAPLMGQQRLGRCFFT